MQKKMIHVLLVAVMALMQTLACDSNGASDPELLGRWSGAVYVPDAPLDVIANFQIVIADESVNGTGTIELWYGNSMFRTTSLSIIGTYSFPNVLLQFTGADDRVDTFIGNMNGAGTQIDGILTMPRLPIPELSASQDPNSQFFANGGDSTMRLERPTE